MVREFASSPADAVGSPAPLRRRSRGGTSCRRAARALLDVGRQRGAADVALFKRGPLPVEFAGERRGEPTASAGELAELATMLSLIGVPASRARRAHRAGVIHRVGASGPGTGSSSPALGGEADADPEIALELPRARSDEAREFETRRFPGSQDDANGGVEASVPRRTALATRKARLCARGPVVARGHHRSSIRLPSSPHTSASPPRDR